MKRNNPISLGEPWLCHIYEKLLDIEEHLEADDKTKEIKRLKKALRDIIKKGNELPLSGRFHMIVIARKALKEGK